MNQSISVHIIYMDMTRDICTSEEKIKECIGNCFKYGVQKQKKSEEGKMSKKQAGDGLCRDQAQADFLSEAEFILKDELQIRTLL